ncbi:hypothetical protein BKA62DRAFT_350505 [Auriculariales sp. MPI-PUGE-AT-0066]|nr:hypothetical protein BKA62DRAFT_350505 [Auriculariales sp. MPI-PUGE-AT-0066]
MVQPLLADALSRTSARPGPVVYSGSRAVTVPDDILASILSWLRMGDMISASHICAAWRSLALSTPMLWWDVHLACDKNLQQAIQRLIIALERSKKSRIHINITGLKPGGIQLHSVPEWERARDLILKAVNRIASIQFPPLVFFECSHAEGCKHVAAHGILAGLNPRTLDDMEWRLAPGWPTGAIVSIPIVRPQGIKRLALRNGQHFCAVAFDSVEDLEVDYAACAWGIGSGLWNVMVQFPAVRVLTVRARDLGPYTGSAKTVRKILSHLSEIRMLYVGEEPYLPEDSLILDYIHSAIDVVAIDFAQSADNLLVQICETFREDKLTQDPWTLLLRSGRAWSSESMMYGPDTAKASNDHEVGVHLADGRTRRFVFHVHQDALHSIARTLLQISRTTRVAVEGQQACRLLEDGVYGCDMSHLVELQVLAAEDADLPVPLQDIELPGLLRTILARRAREGSRLTAGRVKEWLARLRVTQKPTLALRGSLCMKKVLGKVWRSKRP